MEGGDCAITAENLNESKEYKNNYSLSAVINKVNLFIQPLLAFAVFVIAILQYQQAENQSQMKKLRGHN